MSPHTTEMFYNAKQLPVISTANSNIRNMEEDNKTNPPVLFCLFIIHTHLHMLPQASLCAKQKPGMGEHVEMENVFDEHHDAW